jgi:hypothetical protein
MDTPLILAAVVFIGIFLMFFVISLLADLVVVGIALGSAVAAYFLPEWYPSFYEIMKDTLLLGYLGLTDPEQISTTGRYMMSVLIILGGTVLCIPALPFSATYRQMLGANKIGRQDEGYIKSLIKTELDEELAGIRKRLSYKIEPEKKSVEKNNNKSKNITPEIPPVTQPKPKSNEQFNIKIN